MDNKWEFPIIVDKELYKEILYKVEEYNDLREKVSNGKIVTDEEIDNVIDKLSFISNWLVVGFEKNDEPLLIKRVKEIDIEYNSGSIIFGYELIEDYDFLSNMMMYIDNILNNKLMLIDITEKKLLYKPKPS